MVRPPIDAAAASNNVAESQCSSSGAMKPVCQDRARRPVISHQELHNVPDHEAISMDRVVLKNRLSGVLSLRPTGQLSSHCSALHMFAMK